MKSLFQNFLVEPLYNFLIFILDTVPFVDLGAAVIILTVIVRFILFPISKSAIRSQFKMKQIQGPLKEIQKKYKDDQPALAKEMMLLYKENNIKPFSSFLLILVQLPVIFAIYFVFLREGLPEINTDLLYSFVTAPAYVSTTFLGFIDLTAKSIILAFAAGATQFVQAHLMIKKTQNMEEDDKSEDQTDKEKMMKDMMKGMQLQMKYVMPIFMYFIAYSLGAVIALYFTASNVFSIFQEIYIKKVIDKEKVEREATI